MQAIQMIRKVLLLVAAACFGFGTVSAREVVEPVSPVDVVASGYNGYAGGTATKISDPAYALKFAGDATIRLAASAAVDGVFTLYANIFATNGTVTVEAESGISKIRWVGGIECKGVVVKGAKAVEFGDTVTNNAKNETCFTFYGADGFEFEGGDGTFTFVNAVTLTRFPTCAYTIADAAHIGIAARELLGDGGTFTLTNFNITLLDVQGIKADTIAVPDGRYVSLFLCNPIKFGDTGSGAYDIARWSWGGSGSQMIDYDFELSEGSALAIYGSQVNDTFTGTISGSTTLTLGHTASKLPANVNFSGSVDLEGTVTLSNYSSIHCNGDGPFKFGDVTCASYAANGNTFTFKKPANGSIGTLTGGIKVVGDARSAFAVGGLAAGARLDVDGAVKVTVGAGDATATVGLLGADGGWTVSGPTDTAAAFNLIPETEGCAVNLGGKLSLGDLGSAFAVLNLLEGAEVSDTSFDAATVITGKGKMLHEGTSWKDKVEFWADANSGSECFQTVRDFAPGVDPEKIPADRIIWWKDCRADKRTGDAAYGLAMTRFASSSASSINNYPNMYPSLVEDGINGKSYVRLSNGAQCRLGLTLLNATIVDNFSNYQKVKPAYAIVVTRNCSSTTGSAVLSSVKGVLAASGKGYNANIFTNELVEVYRGGEKLADPTSTTWGNSIWGIYSFTTAKAQVNGLATLDSPNNSSQGGGFDYAEVMLFSEAPTEIERKVIEEQLAEKWGLHCAHSGTRESVTLKVEVGGAAASTPLVEYAADDIPRTFTLNVNVPQDFKRDVRYPLVKCADTDTVALGTVTGKSMQGLTIVREGGIAYLYAPKLGLVITVK